MKWVSSSALLRFIRWQVVVGLFFAMMILPAVAQFNVVLSFNVTNGDGPAFGPLVQGRDGNYYGTTEAGGANDWGTVFKVTPKGVVTTVYSFCSLANCTDGYDPIVGLVLGTDGNFYGETAFGGNTNCAFPQGCGTVFKVTPAGKLTTLYIFDGTQGAGPVAGLTLGTDGNFYGLTGTAGGAGTIFKITSSGTLTTLHFFGLPDGIWPDEGKLVLGTDGNFYGTTSAGGTAILTCNDGCGTVYKVTPTGTVTTLHSFSLTDGATPMGGLVQATDGNFYGTTASGGPNQGFALGCGQGSNAGCGTVFQITPSGTFNTLYNFCPQMNCPDGDAPFGTLVQATNGNIYGTTAYGGTWGGGTIFQLSAGTFSTLYSLCDQHDGCPGTEFDGFSVWDGLLQATSGLFYGTAFYGGIGPCNYGCGTVFSWSSGIGPFVRPVTCSGKVGATIQFLGQNFTSSSVVSFNGTPATTSFKSGTFLTATVPAGATTGSVTITTLKGTLQSDKTFRVTPQLLSFNPTSGPVGTAVTITGVSLLQTTRVTFNGKAAVFTVNSDTQVTATVPVGAKTGKIGITTAGGTTMSSGTFTVTP